MPRSVPTQPRGGRLSLGAALSLVSLIAICAAGAGAYVSAVRWVDHTLEVRQVAYEWLTAVLDAESGARGYIASGHTDFIEPYRRAIESERAAAALVSTLVADNPAQLDNVASGNRDAEIIVNHLRELVALVDAGRRDEALSQLSSMAIKAEMDAFREDVHRIRAAEERLLADRRSQATARGWFTLGGSFLLGLAASMLFIIGWRREQRHEAVVTQLAHDARARLQVLSDLGAALSDARTRAQVAEGVVDHGMRGAGADTCTLYMLDEPGSVLELIGDRGVAPQLIDKIRRITETSDRKSFAAWKSGTATWVENDAEYAALFPALATMRERKARAFWSVPLFAEDRFIGLLGAGFYAPRHFSGDERAFVQTLANQCAQALLRASRLEREDEANRWLATTLHSIGDAVIATDAQGRVTLMNPIAERMTGWLEGDAKGRPLEGVFCIFSEQTRQPVESPVTKVLREGAVVGLANHTVLRSKRGIEIPIDDSGAPIRNESGRIVGVVLVFRDVTLAKRDRARNEFLSKAGEALVSSINYETTLANVAHLAVPVIADWCAVDLVDAELGISRQVAVAHVDPSKVQFARELGERYPPDPRASTGVPQVIRTGKSELYTEISEEMLEAGAKDTEHLRIIRDLRLESAMVVPLRARGRIVGAMTFVYAESGRRYARDDLAFVEDFARRAALAIENALALKDAEEARAKEHWLRAEAELANRSKDDFLATVSHELRTPLNAILGWTVTLRSRKPPDYIDRALVIIERNARTQAKLIDDVLDVSRIISGKLALNLGPTNVPNAVTAAIETVTPAAAAKGITIHSDLTDDSLRITADADRMQQIVWNLLSNAVKFTPKGGHVYVRVYQEGSDVCISVRDTGEGIRSAVLPLIFEPFQQADPSTTRRHGGLGLGLAIVKQLVSAHGGSVDALSGGEGKGATFVIRLPARSSAPAVNRMARSTPPVQPEAALDGGPRLDGLRLLIVDDEHDARALLGEILREQGAEVHAAASATEALEKFSAVRPDVIVSDIGMPEADGYALIRKIRALPPEAGGRTPAIALTAYARAEDAQKAFVAGYQMHVTKPVEPTQLATVVANLSGRSLN
jgi:PAS domain S-box-containing protein